MKNNRSEQSRRRRFSIAHFAALFLSGIGLSQLSACSLLNGGMVKPDVTIADVRFGDLTLFETTAEFKVRITNPNDFPLRLNGASHSISLNDLTIGTGTSNESIEVPRLGSAVQTVTVHMSNLSLLRRIQTLVEAKDFDYEIRSTLYPAGGFGLRRITVEEHGRVNVAETFGGTDAETGGARR